MVIFAVIISCLVAGVILIAVMVYNSLVSKKNGVEKSLKNVDTLLLKRYDLMNNLFLQAERAMEHEEVIQVKLAALRQNIEEVNGTDHHDVAALDKALTQTISRFNLIVEQYPDLKAITTVSMSMEANIKLENEIAAARIGYNDNTELYRNAAELFPNAFFAKIFGFNAMKYNYIEVPEERKEVPVPFYMDKMKQKYKG